MSDNLKEFKKILDHNKDLLKEIDGMYLYGSFLYKDFAGDLDIILIIKNYDYSVVKLVGVLEDRYKDLDLDIYTTDEIKSGLEYYRKEFRLEYLAKSKCVIGDPDLFINMHRNVGKEEYKSSIIVRSVDHVQKVRLKYTSSTTLSRDKIKYIKKYYFRILKNLLLYCECGDYDYVNDLLEENIITIAKLKFVNFNIRDIQLSNEIEEVVFIFEEMVKTITTLKI